MSDFNKLDGKVCSVEGCDRKIKAKSLCKRHYEHTLKGISLYRECTFCGKDISHRIASTKYCSNSCKKKSFNGKSIEDYQGRTCAFVNCNNDIDHLSINAKYCSNKCQNGQWNIDNPGKASENSKMWRQENRQRNRDNIYRWRMQNSEQHKATEKQWRQDNKKRKYDQDKKWRENNREHNRVIQRKWKKDKKRTDPLYALSCRFRSLIYNHIVRYGKYTKRSKQQNI